MPRNVDLVRRLELQYIREQSRGLDLSPAQILLLRLLDQNSPVRQEDLVLSTAIDKGCVARLLSQLEGRGLVERTVSPRSRREKLVSLTPEGQSMVKALLQILEQWDDICYRGFTPEERAMHNTFHDRIAANAAAYKKGGI